MFEFNILTDSLPETVVLFERKYPVYTSFRNWIQIAQMAANGSLKEDRNAAKALALCYKDNLPPNIVSAFLGMLQFLNRGADLTAPRGKREKSVPLFSFSQDADIIYAAFYSKYGIDLTRSELHWYAFCALFSSLSEDNPFQTVLKIRTFDEHKLKDPQKRRKLVALKQKFGLEQNGNAREVDVAENLLQLFS